ncbi:hypothetical protein BpHYR1_047354 [Brachionus plicatilis]|uniref:Uncharacterized protein n=1 Tax=Brachionus plicatilis TaxID=10195 RepID=A0A3M7Q9F0_BRAPC|nr:hypothetical protein BpHYR1_047354 [Brachionus plicatilis]
MYLNLKLNFLYIVQISQINELLSNERPKYSKPSTFSTNKGYFKITGGQKFSKFGRPSLFWPANFAVQIFDRRPGRLILAAFGPYSNLIKNKFYITCQCCLILVMQN